jgi:hypothetical protein
MKSSFYLNFYLFRVGLSRSAALCIVVCLLLSRLLFDVFFKHMNGDVSKKYNEIVYTDHSELINKDFMIKHKVLRLSENRVNNLALRTSLVIFDNNLFIYIDTNSKKYRRILSINLYEESGKSISLPELYTIYQLPLKRKSVDNIRNVIKKRNILNFNLLPDFIELHHKSFNDLNLDDLVNIPEKINPVSRRRTSNSVFYISDLCGHKRFPLQPDGLILSMGDTKYNFVFSDKQKFLLKDLFDCDE